MEYLKMIMRSILFIPRMIRHAYDCLEIAYKATDDSNERTVIIAGGLLLTALLCYGIFLPVFFIPDMTIALGLFLFLGTGFFLAFGLIYINYMCIW